MLQSKLISLQLMLWINISGNIFHRKKHNCLVLHLLLLTTDLFWLFSTSINRFKQAIFLQMAIQKNNRCIRSHWNYFSWCMIKQIGQVIEASSIDNANYKVTEALQNVNTDRSSCLSFSSLFFIIQFPCPARTIGVSAKINVHLHQFCLLFKPLVIGWNQVLSSWLRPFGTNVGFINQM